MVDDRKPTGILLDLDGTLYDYDPAHRAGLSSFCRALERDLGVPFSEGEGLYAEAGRRVKARLGNTASSHSRLLYSQAVLEMLGLGSALDSIQNLENAYWHEFFSQMHLRSGVIDFLKEAQHLQIPVCIVTDLTLEIQLKKLLALGIEGLFNALVTSEESGADKPAGGNFLLALEKLGLAEDAFVWMIGDSLEKDGLGSVQSINCRALVMNSSIESKSVEAFNSFADLTAKLETIK